MGCISSQIALAISLSTRIRYSSLVVSNFVMSQSVQILPCGLIAGTTRVCSTRVFPGDVCFFLTKEIIQRSEMLHDVPENIILLLPATTGALKMRRKLPRFG